MTRSYVAALILLSTIVTLRQAEAQDSQYLEGVRSDYNVILVSEIDSGSSVRTKTGNLCFYKYETRIRSIIRGHYQGTKFTFFSESKLSVGADYLTYFSEIDARKYRILQSYSGSQTDTTCKTFMNGFLLLDTETHRIRDIWDGKELRSFVEFGDASDELFHDHAIDKTTKLIDFDYVKLELAK